MNNRNTLLWGALFSGIGVALGAMGAHALKPMLLAGNHVDTFEVAVRYQVYHGLALFILGVLMKNLPEEKTFRIAASCWMTGTFLFSGSLYLLCFTDLHAVVFLTPIGGLFFLGGWVLLIWGLLKK